MAFIGLRYPVVATLTSHTDGSEPTAESTLYMGPFTVSTTTTIKAKAFLFGEWSGAMASATLTKGTYYGGLYPDTPKSHAAHRLDGLFKVLCGRRGATRDH